MTLNLQNFINTQIYVHTRMDRHMDILQVACKTSVISISQKLQSVKSQAH